MEKSRDNFAPSSLYWFVHKIALLGYCSVYVHCRVSLPEPAAARAFYMVCLSHALQMVPVAGMALLVLNVPAPR